MSGSDSSNILNRLEMSHDLRGSLQRAVTYAYQQGHREVTLEHLLLALAEDRDAAVILEASRVDMAALVTEVSDYLGRLDDGVAADGPRQPALGRDIVHIFQSAGAAAQKSQRRAVGSALVLAAIVGEGRSTAAQILRNHGLTFEQAIEALRRANAAARSIEQPPAQSAVAPPPHMAPAPPPDEPAVAPALTAPASTPAAGAPPPSTQAAREILAGARERIAAARNQVAATGQPARSPQMPAAEAAAIPSASPPPEPASSATVGRPQPEIAPARASAEPESPQEDSPAPVAMAPAPPASAPVVADRAPHQSATPVEPPRMQPLPPPAQETQQAAGSLHSRPEAMPPPAGQPGPASQQAPSAQPPQSSPPVEMPHPVPSPESTSAQFHHQPPHQAQNQPHGQPRSQPSSQYPGAAAAGAAQPGPPPAPRSGAVTAAEQPGPRPYAGAQAPAARPQAPPPMPQHRPEPQAARPAPNMQAPPPGHGSYDARPQPPAGRLPAHREDLRPTSSDPAAQQARPARVEARPRSDYRPAPRPQPGPDPRADHRPDPRPETRHERRPEGPRPMPPPPGYTTGRPERQPPMHLPSGTPGADDDAPAFDPRSLTAAIPTRMRAGRPVTVDVRVPRRHLEALSGGADAVSRAQHVITKAMAMRLKGQPGEFTIENASPETQWSEGFGGPLSDDIVSWRWIVTPRRSGRLNLQVSGTTRIVGRDGLAAERPLPAQRVTIRVTPDYGAITRRAAVLLLIGLGAGALGYYGEGLFDMGRAMLAQVTR